MFRRSLTLGACGLVVLGLGASPPPTWSATLDSPGRSALSGTVRIQPGPGPYPTEDRSTPGSEGATGLAHVSIELAGAKAGSWLTWYVHEGDCRKVGPVVGNRVDYAPLLINREGRAASTAIIPALPATGKFSVGVHKGDDAAELACGTLVPETTSTAPHDVT